MIRMFSNIFSRFIRTLAPLFRVFPTSVPVEAPRKMRIALRQALSGAMLGKVELEATELIEDLRRLLTERFHHLHFQDKTAAPQLQLIHGQHLLGDCDNLREAGLSDGATVDIVMRRRQRFVVTASDDSTSRLWDIEDGGCFLVLRGHSDSVLMAKPSPDNHTVATCSRDGTVKLWNVASGACLLTLEHDQPVVSVAFSPDGLLLATGTYHGTLRIWTVSKEGTGTCWLQVQMHESSPIRAVDFSRDGDTVLTACGDGGTTHVWEVKTGSCKLQLDEQEETILSAHFSPDGHTVVMGCSDDSVQVWDVANGFCKQDLEGHDGAVYSARFSADGQRILSSSSDGTAKLWRLGACERTLVGHESDVFCASFSADGRLVGTASADQTAKIWDGKSGRCNCTLKGHTAPIHSIEFSRA